MRYGGFPGPRTRFRRCRQQLEAQARVSYGPIRTSSRGRDPVITVVHVERTVSDEPIGLSTKNITEWTARIVCGMATKFPNPMLATIPRIDGQN